MLNIIFTYQIALCLINYLSFLTNYHFVDSNECNTQSQVHTTDLIVQILRFLYLYAGLCTITVTKRVMAVLVGG